MQDEHIAIETAPTESGQALADSLLSKIYAQLGEASANEIVLEQSWIRLGKLLLQFKDGEHWRPLGFGSFERFMLDLRDRYNRGKTQLWSYVTVVEKLLPTISAEALEEIGISKALELKRGIVQGGGKAIPQNVIDAARKQETTIKELRAMIGKAMNLLPDTKGSWFDFGGTFFTPEEKKEFAQAVKVTLTVLGIKKDIPDHIQRKEVFLNWARESLATHGPEVYGAPAVNTPATLMLPPVPTPEPESV